MSKMEKPFVADRSFKWIGFAGCSGLPCQSRSNRIVGAERWAASVEEIEAGGGAGV